MIARSLLWALLCLLVAACSSWEAPPLADPDDLRQRAVSDSVDGVQVHATVLSRQDSLRLIGADVLEHGIEPVWLEVVNGSDGPLTLLRAGADPDYFSPLEVSWVLHGGIFRREGNEAIDRHLNQIAFPLGQIAPGRTRSGLLFTNPHLDTKLLNIDLIGPRSFVSLTLFPPIPEADGRVRERQVWTYSPEEIRDYQGEQDFRKMLETFLCCRPDRHQERQSQPLTVVLVGELEDLGTALARRGYRRGNREQDAAERLLGRSPDFVLRKWSQAGTPGNWLRLWTLPATFRGLPVLVAQVGAPRGGRFASELLQPSDDPAVDDIRDMLVQELLYSRGLDTLAVLSRGYVPEAFSGRTDGTVAVLFVDSHRVELDEAEVLYWHSQEGAEAPPR